MNSFINTFLLIPIFIKMVYKVFIVNEIKHKPYLFRTLERMEQKYGEKISPAYRKRFDLYTKIATIFIYWLETLRGQQLNQQQKQMALLFCGLTPLFDDLLDEQHFSSEEIYRLIQKQMQRGTLIEKLCIGLFEEMEHIQTDRSWTTRWQQAMDYQISSQKQTEQHLSTAEIKDITSGKGGYSLLLYLDAILPGQYSKSEGEAIYQMGAIIQLTNDIFDIYKDRNEGIYTLATTCSDVAALRDYYLTEVTKNIAQFKALGYKRIRVRQFLLQYQLIISRGKVALDQLLALQRRDGGKFSPDNYSRKELICDMELWTNIRKSLLITIRETK